MNSQKKKAIRNLPKLLPGPGKTRIQLESEVRDQADELKLKSDQLITGIGRQKLAAEEINIRTKAMEFTSDGIFLIDATKADFPFTYVNRSFQKISGFTKKEMIGQSYFSLKGDHPDPRIVKEIKNILRMSISYSSQKYKQVLIQANSNC